MPITTRERRLQQVRQWRPVRTMVWMVYLCFLCGNMDMTAAFVPAAPATIQTTTKGLTGSSMRLWNSASFTPQEADGTDTLVMIEMNDYRYSASDWLHNIKSIPRSFILKEIQGPVLTILLWSTFVSVLHKALIWSGHSSLAQAMCLTSTTPHSWMVSSLGLLLVFRTNSAYQRFAEGRQIWETILSISRNMSRMASLYETELGSDRKRRVFRMLAAFPYLLKHHIQPHCLDRANREKLNENALILRQPSVEGALLSGLQRMTGGELKEIVRPEDATSRECCVDRRSLPWCLLPPPVLKKCAEASNRPLWLCNRLSQELTSVEYSSIHFTSRERSIFLGHVDKLSQCIGECERIHQTAVPLNYARHSIRSLTVWLVTLPFAMIRDFGLLTGPVMGVIAWLLLGVYQIGYTIEDPFQGSLRLQSLCDAIYHDVMFFGTTRMNQRETAFQLDNDTVREHVAVKENARIIPPFPIESASS